MGRAVINYLRHDGFVLQTDNYVFIFDYYDDRSSGNIREAGYGVIGDDILKLHKSIYVFVSHSHGDHYNKVIFNWRDVNPDIHYVLSSDTGYSGNMKNVFMISEDQSITTEGISIRALGSTDEGVSFLVKADGLTIFHAGDLNWWHWKDENDDYNKKMSEDYKYQIGKLSGEKVDIAFFPVDPRLEEYYSKGGEYFIEKVAPKLFIPMHFWDKYSITEDFADLMRNSDTKVKPLLIRGQKIEYNG